MEDEDAPYIQNNKKKLRWIVVTAPYAVAILAAAGGGIDVGIILDHPGQSYFIPALIVISDLGIGYWQGRRLGKNIASLAENPRSFSRNFHLIFFPAILIGMLVGIVNAVLMGYSRRVDGLVVIATPIVGLLIGLILGALVGLTFGFYTRWLEAKP